jgi:hypothetical protein
MALHIDCTTPEKIEAFADQILKQHNDGKVVDLAKAAKDAEVRRIWLGKMDFWHNLHEGDRVFCSWRQAARLSAYGIAEELLIEHEGRDTPLCKFRVRFEDGTVAVEHPDHLTHVQNRSRR